MDYKQFGEKLLTVILWLIGLYCFNLFIPITIIYASDYLGEMTFLISRYSYWLGQIAFGVIIYRLTRQHFKKAVSIGILATMLPVYGGLFYLLTATLPTDKLDERRKI